MAHSDITEIHKIVYDELDTTIKQIRVLELFPGDDADPIQCKTHRVNLADYPSYTALSYVWGDARRTESITFNGNSDFSVTHNLWVALHHLRKGNRGSVFLWVDALCINQTHFDEKSRQVEHMGEIYRQATKTCIFLGASADDSDHAIDVLERLDGANLQSDANTLTDRDLRALAALMQRPWWSRVWIIQEALLSPRLEIWCGARRGLSMELFMRLDDIRRGYHRPSGTDHPSPWWHTNALRNPFSHILTWWDDKTLSAIHSGGSGITQWADTLIEFQSTNPRDKIYGLLGLATADERAHLMLQPDYNLPVAGVYARATAYFIANTGSLLPLRFDNDNKNTAAHPGLPSWSPDYSQLPLNTSDPSWFRPAYIPLSAGPRGDDGVRLPPVMGPLPPTTDTTYLFPSGGNRPELHLSGFPVDTVVYASPNPHVIPQYAGTDAGVRKREARERVRLCLHHVKEWEAKAITSADDNQSRRYPLQPNPDPDLAPLTKSEAFWRTLSCNRQFRDVAWPADMAASTKNPYFETWMGRAAVPDSYKAENPHLDPVKDEADLVYEYVRPWLLAAVSHCLGRCFVVTAGGYFGLAPERTRVGDAVCLLEGGEVPFVLRRAEVAGEGRKGEEEGGREGEEEDRYYSLVGEAYVHGVTDGTWLSERRVDGSGEEGGLVKREFVLV